jgi:hypothetical protein
MRWAEDVIHVRMIISARFWSGDSAVDSLANWSPINIETDAKRNRL